MATDRPAPPSIRRRITINVAALVTLVLTLMAAGSTVALRAILDQQLSAQLGAITQRAHDLINARTAPIVSQELLRAAVPPGAFVLCLGASGQIVSSNVPAGLDLTLLLPRVTKAGPGVYATLDDPTAPVRAVLVPVDQQEPLLMDDGGNTLTVTALVVGFDTSRSEHLLRLTALLEIGLTIAAGALILLLLPPTLKQGLRPLRGMTEAAQAVAAGDSDRRLPADTEVAETVILARAVNEALDARREAESRLRQFVADASHELRTPLTTIEGWAELHRQGGLTDPDAVGRAMDRIAGSASHLTALVEDLALLARLDVGRPLERNLVDLAALTENVVEDLRVIDPERVVTTEIAPAGGAMVEGDEQRLRQVVLNLTGNALQHTPAGTPIAVEMGRYEDRVVLSVADAGPGIPVEHLERIFDRFYRAGTLRTTGGNGLGLAIVRSLVVAHGGSVTVSSNVQGTRFTVTLPAAVDQPEPSQVPGR